MRKSYPSDISKEQFKIIEPILDSAKKKTKPRKLALYDIYCGLTYVLTTGCQWRELPHDFPKWGTVYYYFQIWDKKEADKQSVLEVILKKLAQDYRESVGREADPSMLIVDSQSVKNTDSAASKGYDAGKKVSGVKRHIAVDTQGAPRAVKVTTANVTDRTGAVNMIDENKSDLKSVEKLLVDGGYSGDKFATKINEIIAATTEVVKRNELHKFVVLPKRWIVERSLSWLEKFRRLWKNCEKFIETSQQMVVLAFTIILLRRI